MGCRESKPFAEEKNSGAVYDVPPFLENYPKPKPPKSSRKEIFNINNFGAVEQRVNSVPEDALDSYDRLLQYVIGESKDEIEIAWALYLWIALLSTSDLCPADSPAHNTPKSFIKYIADGKGDMASFYTFLCRKAKIQCVTLEGVCKDQRYSVGVLEKDVAKLQNSWNAVYLKKSWRFVHVNFGMEADPKMKHFFFIIEPEEMKFWCHPDQKEWQLLQSPLIRKEFVTLPFCKAMFFHFGLKLLQPRFGKMKSNQGKGLVEITIDRTQAQGVVLQYHLKCNKYFNSKENGNNVNSGNFPHPRQSGEQNTERDDQFQEFMTENPSKQPSELKRYVYMSRVDSNITFDIVFPSPGSYVLDIFGKSLNERSGFSVFTLVCQFKFICYEETEVNDLEPLPDAPDIGWGPTPYCSRIGIRAMSHSCSHIYYVPDEPFQVIFEMQTTFEFKVELINEQLGLNLDDCVSIASGDKTLTLDILIQKEEQFALKVFARKSETQNFVNVINYLLIHDKQNGYTERFTKRMLRERLEKALESGSEKDVCRALCDFELHNVVNHGEIIKAQDRLKYFEQKKDLSEAVKRRNIRVLEKVIQSAKESPYTRELEEDITRAEKCLTKLRKLEGFLHPIQRMEPLTVSEIKSYQNPLQIIKDIFTATYLLLGEEYDNAKEWRCVQSLLSKTGQDSLLSRILQLDIEEVPQETVHLADIILEPHNLHTAREASNGAVTFYQWAKYVVEERKSKSASIEPNDFHVCLPDDKPKRKNKHQNVKSKVDTGMNKRVYPEENISPSVTSKNKKKKEKKKKKK